ncbi:MAG: apolipoprotein N-acyltransferase, partial [Desulfovibrionaceae bacterium]|nr:apolipoprotein N-acyltransferase [Desulfovibrionaceae bacterium]
SGELGEDIQAMVRQEAVHLLFGAPEMERSPGKTAIYNRAYLLDPAGRTLNYYDKEHLVPFGEYAPSWLRIPILEFLLEQVGNLDPGTHTAPLRISTPVWEARIGMLICYEAIFPELARKRVADGSNIFLTISNDAWFGDTSAPEQHLQLAAMRAVEQGKWLVRATNTGISTIIDQHGQRRVQSGLFTTETLSALAYTQEGTTLFYLIGPYLPYLLIFTLALLLISGYIERRKT